MEADIPLVLNHPGQTRFAGNATVMCVAEGGTAAWKMRAPAESADYFPRPVNSAKPSRATKRHVDAVQMKHCRVGRACPMDSVDPIPCVESELDRCFVWLARFEASIPGAQDAIDKPYAGPSLQATIGYSWFKPSTPGMPALTLANVALAQGAKGQTHLAGFIERFLDGNGGLEARVLYLENVDRAGFGHWLLRAGFQRCVHETGEFPTYYLVR